MSKQKKIVIKVQLSSHKSKILGCFGASPRKVKVMEIASGARGVTSIAISGDQKDQVEVIGEATEVDPVKLTNLIRKKVSRSANLVRVEEVKPKEEPKKEQALIPLAQGIYYYPNQYYPQQVYEPVYNQCPPACSIM